MTVSLLVLLSRHVYEMLEPVNYPFHMTHEEGKLILEATS